MRKNISLSRKRRFNKRHKEKNKHPTLTQQRTEAALVHSMPSTGRAPNLYSVVQTFTSNYSAKSIYLSIYLSNFLSFPSPLPSSSSSSIAQGKHHSVLPPNTSLPSNPRRPIQLLTSAVLNISQIRHLHQCLNNFSGIKLPLQRHLRTLTPLMNLPQ